MVDVKKIVQKEVENFCEQKAKEYIEEYVKVFEQLVYLCWQNDNSVLGVATTEDSAKEMCSENGDAYMPIELDSAQRDYVDTTELCTYNVNGKFLTYQECIEQGLEFEEVKPDESK